MHKKWLYLIVLVLCFNCADKSEEFTDSYPEVVYTPELFISADYIFENEGLNRPVMVSVLPETDDITVFDEGNACLYVFSSEGEYIRKTGRPGEGPGEFNRLFPDDFFITSDDNGTIYVFNSSLQRMSLFSPEGKFIRTFRSEHSVDLRGTRSGMSVAHNGEIVMNLPKSGCYVSVYSQTGELLREIGAIDLYWDTNEQANRRFAQGFPFQDENGTYYVFLSYIPVVKLFDEAGHFIAEKPVDLPRYQTVFERGWKHPRDRSENETSYTIFFNQVVFRNGRFYLLLWDYAQEEKNCLNIYVFNKDIQVTKKLVITGEELDIIPDFMRYVLSATFNITADETIYLPVRPQSEMLRALPVQK